MKDINFKGKLVMIMGPPASGKSTLASEVHTELKKRILILFLLVKQQLIILLNMVFQIHLMIRW